MDRQGTWEILLLPVGKTAAAGSASVNKPDLIVSSLRPRLVYENLSENFLPLNGPGIG